MKTTIKIAILLLAVILAVGGVLIYAKTRVAPPREYTPSDQYSPLLADVSKNKATHLQLQQTIDMARRMYENDRIDKQAADKAIDDAVAQMSVMVVNEAKALFNRPEWPRDDIRALQDKVTYVNSLADTDGSSMANRNGSTARMNMVAEHINVYNKALSALNQVGFISVPNAREKIKNANSLANDSHISACTPLKEKLRQVPSRIAASHVAYINARVNSLGYYTSYYNSHDYENRFDDVCMDISNYNDNKRELYGNNAPDISELMSRGQSYYTNRPSYLR